MSKKFKSQASSSRAASGALGGFGSPFGAAHSSFSAFGSSAGAVSSLSYIAEPPDLSKISESNVVVGFKNLSKKDSTTKAKALEDLQDLVVRKAEENATLEDGFLEAWFNVYPRLSIDTSRRVRQVAHTVHGVVVSSAGKRVARLMPKVIGAWLAGLYDNDRPVMRAAQESLLQAFTTDAKRQGVWKAYQGAILEFVEDAILVQTPQTLSDDRSTRSDDMEMKHARVVATAAYVCNNLLARLSPDELEKNAEKLETILSNKKLWTFAHHDDSFVRRAIYGLLRTVLPIADSYLDWKVISSSVLSKSLAKSQSGSSLDFANMLITLTEKHPAIWTSDYSGKKSASSRLCQYLKNGSEGAPAAYWEIVAKLLQILPMEVFGSPDGYALTDAINVADAIHHAISSRDEYRPNLPAAWTCYIRTVSHLARHLTNDNDKQEFVEKKMFPILEQYHSATSKDSEWTLPPGSAISLSTECFISIINIVGKDRAVAFWKEVTDQLILAVRISEPEESATYKSSQDAICARSKRYFSWASHVLEKTSGTDDSSFVPEMLKDASKPLLESSVALLTSRNGKPYGAAAVVEDTIATEFLRGLNSDITSPFIANQLPQLVLTPSGSRLISILFLYRDTETFKSALPKVLDTLEKSNLKKTPSAVLRNLFSSVSTEDFTASPTLHTLIQSVCTSLIEGRREDWDDLLGVFENPAIPDNVKQSLAETIISHLYTQRMLMSVWHLVNKSEPTLHIFAHGQVGRNLIFRLLYLSENSEEDVEDTVTTLLRKIDGVRGEEDQANTVVEIMHRNFVSANRTLLSVDTMIEVAQDAIAASSDPSKILSQLLPTATHWDNALKPFLELPPLSYEAVVSPLEGLVFVVPREETSDQKKPAIQVDRDANDLTAAYRLAAFTTKILSGKLLELLDEDIRNVLFTNLPLVTQLISRDLDIRGSRNTRVFHESQDVDECAEVVLSSRALIKSWADTSESLFDHWDNLVEKLQGNSPKSFHLAETFVTVLTGKESWKAQQAEERLQWARRLKVQESPYALAAIIAAYHDAVVTHPLGVRLCNELVADLTTMRSDSNEAIVKLVQLRLLGPQPLQQVQNQRLVILVNRLVSRLEDSQEDPALASAIALALYEVIPLIKEMYGSQWSAMFDLLRETWNMDDDEEGHNIPLINANLRLFSRLRSLSIGGESNDDLEDAWAEAEKTQSESIIEFLGRFATGSGRDLHRRIVQDLLGRTAASLPVEHLKDPSNLLTALQKGSKSIQLVSCNLYRRTIPKAMEELALEVALGEKKAELPRTLLDNFSPCPDLDHITWSSADDHDCSRLRAYFLGWAVTFDLFAHATIPVKEQFTAQIKERGFVPLFLNLIYEFLQLPNGKLIDASKMDIRGFEFDQSVSEEAEAKWFAVHLYYLCLKHLPSLATSWWNESKNKIKGPIEAWTEKYFSPLVIEDALKGVHEWASSQDWAKEEQPMEVKVSFNVKEIVASIEIDEDSPPSSICISMPTAYPLHLPVVIGRTRIAVSEKKWQSWLRNIAGAVKFQGSLIDALIIFRRNVQGALKGQTECAICYSVVSPSMKLPNKRCATCKNTFHSDCLFRWFTSSNASSCPLCRNNFIYS